MKKTHDLAVKLRSYTDRNGDTKNAYENVGSVMTNDDGSKFLLLKRTFNPAGVPNPDSRDTLVISIFPIKEQGQEQQPAQQRQSPPQQAPAYDDDIPF